VILESSESADDQSLPLCDESLPLWVRRMVTQKRSWQLLSTGNTQQRRVFPEVKSQTVSAKSVGQNCADAVRTIWLFEFFRRCLKNLSLLDCGKHQTPTS